MKIYLVTVDDDDAIQLIDDCIEAGEQLAIGISASDLNGPIADIEEYVNVDSP